MLRGAKIKLKTLVYDDSGIALAFTLVAFLLLAMMTMSVYAAGHVIRQRIELQAAADNAAYSGALVQADTLSRIAVLNRAMAWTYVQANRMHTDYIMNKWLSDVASAFKQDAEYAKFLAAFNDASCTCGVHKPSAYQNNAVGELFKGTRNPLEDLIYYTGNDSTNGLLYLQSNIDGNSKYNRFYDISGYPDSFVDHAAACGKSFSDIGPLLADANRNLVSMNEAIKNLVDNLKERIQTAATSAAAAQGKFTCGIQVGDPQQWFQVLTSDNDGEGRFLSWYPQSETDRSDNDNWNSNQVRAWWGPPGNNNSPGFYRQYNAGAHIMKWEWIVYLYHGIPCTRNPTPIGQGSTSVSAVESAGDYGKGETAKPQVLLPAFFGKSGAIVTAVKRRVENPFAAGFLGSTSPEGLGFYGAFSLSKVDMWAVSAARAGVRLSGSDTGCYETTWTGGNSPAWNLSNDDWDAVMLPLAVAWKNGTDRQWGDGENASDILVVMKNMLGVDSAFAISEEVNPDVLH